MTNDVIVKSFDAPDETWSLPGEARMELVKLGGVTVGRGTAPPAWRWSTHVKPRLSPPSREESCAGSLPAAA